MKWLCKVIGHRWEDDYSPNGHGGLSARGSTCLRCRLGAGGWRRQANIDYNEIVDRPFKLKESVKFAIISFRWRNDR